MMNNTLPGISGWPPSPRGQVLAPFCTSAKPFHASESYSAKPATTSTIPSPSTPSLPIPLTAPTTCEPAPAAVVNHECGRSIETISLVAGKPPLPLPTTASAATTTTTTTTNAVAARAQPCVTISTRPGGPEEGFPFATTANTAFLSRSPPAVQTSPVGDSHTAWSPSPPRTAARHPLKPIHVPPAAPSTAAGAAAAAAAAATLVTARSSTVVAISALPPSSGFSHKLRRRLLNAPEGEESGCGNGSHARRRTVSDMATVAAAAFAPDGSAVAVGARDANRGAADETAKRPGLRRRRSCSLVDRASLSRCQSSAIQDNQRDEQSRGTVSATCSEGNITRSISCEPFYGASTEPPRGVAGGPFLHRRSSTPSSENPGTVSSRNESCEIGPQIVGEPPHPKGEKVPPAGPVLVPPTSRRVSASPSHSASFSGCDRGLRISPLQRSDSACSVSEPATEDESCAGVCFFIGGSQGSEGAPNLPSPLLCCSPPVLAKLDCVPRAGEMNKTGGGISGDDRSTGLESRGGRFTKDSPYQIGGRSVDGSPSTPPQQQQQQQQQEQLEDAAMRDAETPKLSRHNSYFDKKGPLTTQGSSPTGNKLSGKVLHGQEPPDGQARLRRKNGKSGCEVPSALPGAIDWSAAASAKVHLPASSAPAVTDRCQSSVRNLSPPDKEHGCSPGGHQLDQLRRRLSPVSKVEHAPSPAIDKQLADQFLSTSPDYSLAGQTTPKLATRRTSGSSGERRDSRHLSQDGGGDVSVHLSPARTNGGSGGGGSLPASSTNSAGGTTAINSSRESSLLVRRNDSILKSLLTGSGLDPIVGFPKDVGGVEATYEFGLWKKKSIGNDSKAGNKILSFPMCPLVAAPAMAKREGIETDSELPPPPLKGLPTNARPSVPFPQAVERGMGAITTRKVCHRSPTELSIVASPGRRERAGMDDRRASPCSPQHALSVNVVLPVFTNLPARLPIGKTRIDHADSSMDRGDQEARRSTTPCQPHVDDIGHARDASCSTSPLASTGADASEGLKESSSLSETGPRTLPRESPPPGVIPSPSPLPSPRQSPRLSPRAARAGTRPCAEAKAYLDDQPCDVRIKEGDPGHKRGLKASPPLIASRFPLSSHFWIAGGGSEIPRIRGRRQDVQGDGPGDMETSSSCSSGGGSLAKSRGLGSSSDRDESSPPVALDGSPRHGPSNRDKLVDVRNHRQPDNSRRCHQGASHTSTKGRSSPRQGAEMSTPAVPALTESDQDDHVADMPVRSGGGPAAGQHSITQRWIRPQTALAEAVVSSACQAAATAGRPEDRSLSPTTFFSGFGQDASIHSSRDDLSDSLTVEISTDLFDESDSGRGSCRHEGHWVADKGCHAGVSLDARRNAIHWKRGEQIGMGSFGKVFKGLNESTGELFAVKQISLKRGLQDDINTLEAEIDLMKDLDHRHIVRYCGTDRGTRHLYIFLEYVPGGSIASMLEQFGLFREDLVRRFMHQILLGMRYLHEKGIIHRDVKGANVLVTEQGIAKLADFGCSKQFQGVRTPSFDDSLHTIRGSIPWMAPEMIKQTGHGRSADVWSVGATMIEMYTARYPWPPFSNNIAAMYHVATATEPPAFPKNASSEATDFLSKCLIIDPDKRLKASELLEHPFLLVAAAELEASSGQGPGGFGAMDGAAG